MILRCCVVVGVHLLFEAMRIFPALTAILVLAVHQGQGSFDAACTSEIDCQLNGRCVSGVCECLRAWKGAHCQFLNQGKGDALLRLPHSSSWGGRIIPADKSNEAHHAFISVFGGGCGMNEWGNTSHIVHATIPANVTRFNVPATVETIAIPAYAHCVDVQKVNASLWLMVHNGDGLPRACGFGSKDCPKQPLEWLAQCDSGNGTTPSSEIEGKPAPPLPKGFEPSNGIHWASSPFGPWKAPTQKAVKGFPYCDCPALHILRNGSVVVWCQPMTWNYVPNQEGVTVMPIYINQGWGTPFVAKQPTINVPHAMLERAKKGKNAIKFDDPTLYTDENSNWSSAIMAMDPSRAGKTPVQV